MCTSEAETSLLSSDTDRMGGSILLLRPNNLQAIPRLLDGFRSLGLGVGMVLGERFLEEGVAGGTIPLGDDRELSVLPQLLCHSIFCSSF